MKKLIMMDRAHFVDDFMRLLSTHGKDFKRIASSMANKVFITFLLLTMSFD